MRSTTKHAASRHLGKSPVSPQHLPRISAQEQQSAFSRQKAIGSKSKLGHRVALATSEKSMLSRQAHLNSWQSGFEIRPGILIHPATSVSPDCLSASP